MSQQKCVACKNVDFASRLCLDTWGINLNTAADRIILPEGVSLADLAADVMCPEAKPFYDSATKVCADCPGKLFDYVSNSCIECPTNKQYDPQSHSCIKKTVNVTNLNDQNAYQRIIFADGSNSLTSEQQKQNALKNDYNVVICPIETPFYVPPQKNGTNQGQCISCQ